MVQVRTAQVSIRETELTKKILDQARLLDHHALGQIWEIPYKEVMEKYAIGWVSGRVLPKRLDDYSYYAVLNTEDGDVFLINVHPEFTKKFKQIYLP